MIEEENKPVDTSRTRGLNKSHKFTSENQPAIKGHKKTKDIKKLMVAFGKSLAPADLLQDATVKHFLDENKLSGTVHEVLIARLYGIALYSGDLKAIKLILDTLSGEYKGGQNGVIINFITPPSVEQEKTIVLENDSFTVVPTVDQSTD